jgi:pyruvate carboxylase
MAFKLEIVNVFRDFVQGLYANRIPLDHPKVLRMFALWDKLVQSSRPEDLVKFGPIEIGGADPQVSTEFRNRDYMEPYRKARAVARLTALRPLWRGANGFLLKPSHPDDLRHLLTHLAEDIAAVDELLSPQQREELLRVKIFDSQGNMDEVQSSVNIIKELRAKGHPITAEIAIPYSREGDLYPDELYVQKAIAAARILKESGMPLAACRISLKDMGGELDAASAQRLLPKIIQALKNEGAPVPLGLHSHDTGLAKKAYAAAIAVCKHVDVDYPLTIDTVECDLFNPNYTGENEYKNTGFTSLLALNEELLKNQIDLGLREDQKEFLSEIADLSCQVAQSHSVVRVDSALTGEELREFHIPGGAFASFSNAVVAMNLAKQLGITQEEAYRVAGNALNAVARLMGNPFAVTPGYQNKQIAALNLLQNMINEKAFSEDPSFAGIISKVLKPLTDAQVSGWFLNNLSPVVKEFLRSEMPAETIARLGYPTDAQVHPVIRAAIPKRTNLLTDDLQPKVKTAEKIAEKLLKEGRIKATELQAEAVLKKLKMTQPDIEKLLSLFKEKGIIYTGPNGTKEYWQGFAFYELQQFFILKGDGLYEAGEKANEIIAALSYKIIQTHVTWALELGDPTRLESMVNKYWWREADPQSENYSDAVKKSKAGKNPVPDAIQTIQEYARKNKISQTVANEYVHLVREKERADIKINVLDYILDDDNEAAIAYALAGNKSAIEYVTEALYTRQEELIRLKESRGESFVLPQERRLDILLDCLNEELNELTRERQMDLEHKIDFKQIIFAKRHELENTFIKAHMPGKLTSLGITQPGPIKKGQLIATIDAMKTEHRITAAEDGYIESIDVQQGADVTLGQLLMKYRKNETVADLSVFTEDQTHFDLTLAKNRHRAFSHSAQAIEKMLLKKEEAIAQMVAEKESFENEIHIIGNRAGCAKKLYDDLKKSGRHVKVLYVKGDKSTPVIQNALTSGEAIEVTSYNDHQVILNVLEKLAQNNPGKKIFFHPGWGFLSEDDAFVAKVETLAKRYNVEFVGPPSEAMNLAGGKKTFRDAVKRVAPESNPGYFGNKTYSAAQLAGYIKSGFGKGEISASRIPSWREARPILGLPSLARNDRGSANSIETEIDTVYREHFAQVMALGGDVVIKAIAGGGGRGIAFFKYDPNKSEEDNYRNYVITVQDNVNTSEKLFNNGEVLTEQCIRGVTRHVEVQFATTFKGSQIFGLRDCTAQNNGQKIIETNIVQGDYSPETIEKIVREAKKVADELARINYKGVGTLEMLVLPDGTFKFLEVNTRVQVEHMVTEEDIKIRTGLDISLPRVNLAFSKHPNLYPDEVLKREFSLTDQEVNKLMAVIFPGTERVTHFRLNSRQINLQTGKSAPAFYDDYMWPSKETLHDLAARTRTKIVLGGIGEGLFDAQAGAICGKDADTVQAAQAIIEMVETSRAAYRRADGALSTDFVLAFHQLMYKENGNFNPHVSTKTVDEFLKAIEAKKIVIEMDFQHSSVSPKLKEGTMQRAFTEFLAQKEAQEKLAAQATNEASRNPAMKFATAKM